jgi:penicillin amidase
LRSTIRLFLPALVLGALLVLGARGAGVVPPLGPFLNPAVGVWALARTAELPSSSEGTIPGLTTSVRVVYDDRGVPHIFAENEADAWRAQGYVLARDRLFQLEIQTRAASGTLSELVGPRARDADLATRRRGFRWVAERNFNSLDSASLAFRAAKAYAEGVNAWIDRLTPAELPLEYRLLRAAPARWQPINTFYLFLQMSYTLAWSESTLGKLEARALVGQDAADALFPVNSPVQAPIQPNGQRSPRYEILRIPPPGTPDTLALIALTERQGIDSALALPRGDPVGSNNWVVGPGRTVNGAPILAGDPHLELSLPSIWYELHLQVRGGPEVAGVTFAGSPGVIIGFNRDVAWSFTNTGADVRDHYRETVDDPARPTRYQVDGAWRPLELREEAIRGPTGEVIAVDTLRLTHRGPLMSVQGQWLSIRWTAWDARSAGEEFLRLDRAGNVSEWLDGWKDFVAPAQNGIVADRQGNIAIRSTGKYPLRPGNGRGDEIRDGSTGASDWIGFLPLERYPTAVNPAQGFLASANQQPLDPRVNPAYLGFDWPSPWRAIRINHLLREDSTVTAMEMQGFQTDSRSERAEKIVPFLLVAGHTASDPDARRAGDLLSSWDRRYSRESQAAGLFERVMTELYRLLWDELVPPGSRPRPDQPATPVALPEDAVLLELLVDSTNAWWNNRNTERMDDRNDILPEALRLGYQSMVREWGAPGDAWRWDRVHHANIWHLLRIPALSTLDLPVQGGPSTLTPSPGNGNHGPSWRMVVELGAPVRGAGMYPGGQSGNPASSRYDDRVRKWQEGSLDSILFPVRPEDIPPMRARSMLLLQPGVR